MSNFQSFKVIGNFPVMLKVLHGFDGKTLNKFIQRFRKYNKFRVVNVFDFNKNR